MAGKRSRWKNKYLIICDAVGISHFIVANIAIALGAFTDLFQNHGERFPGLQFVYEYFDLPVYFIVKNILPTSGSDAVTTLVAGEFVIVVSSIIYGVLTAVVLKVVFGAFTD